MSTNNDKEDIGFPIGFLAAAFLFSGLYLFTIKPSYTGEIARWQNGTLETRHSGPCEYVYNIKEKRIIRSRCEEK